MAKSLMSRLVSLFMCFSWCLFISCSLLLGTSSSHLLDSGILTANAEDDYYDPNGLKWVYDVGAEAINTAVEGAVTAGFGAPAGAAAHAALNEFWNYLWNQAYQAPEDFQTIIDTFGTQCTIDKPIYYGQYFVNGERHYCSVGHSVISGINGSAVAPSHWRALSLYGLILLNTDSGPFGVRNVYDTGYMIASYGGSTSWNLSWIAMGYEGLTYRYEAIVPDLFENNLDVWYHTSDTSDTSGRTSYAVIHNIYSNSPGYTVNVNPSDYLPYYGYDINYQNFSSSLYYGVASGVPISLSSPDDCLLGIYDYLEANYPEYDFDRVYYSDYPGEEETTELSTEFPTIDDLELPYQPEFETFPDIALPDPTEIQIVADPVMRSNFIGGVSFWWTIFFGFLRSWRLTWIVPLALVLALLHYLLKRGDGNK